MNLTVHSSHHHFLQKLREINCTLLSRNIFWGTKKSRNQTVRFHFRQINSLMKKLFSRNYSRKSWHNCHNFFIDELIWRDSDTTVVTVKLCTIVEITEFYCQDLVAKIPSNQLFTSELYTKLIWRRKICLAVNFKFSHTVHIYTHTVQSLVVVIAC